MSRRFLTLTPIPLLILCIAGLLAFELWRSHNATRKDAEQSVQNLTHLLSEQTLRTMQSVDLTLQGIVEALEGNNNIPENDANIRAEMRSRLRTLPYVRALFVIGPDGFISHDTDFPSTPRVSLADRPYFLAHRDDPSLGLHIGHPLRSRSVGVWFVSLSRRIEKPDGSFGGIAVAALEPLYFEGLYRQILVGDGTIALFLDDGTLLARSPQNDEAMGKTFTSDAAARSLPTSNRGFVWTTSPIDGIRRLAGFQLLDGIPIVVVATLNETDVMKVWRSHANVLIAGSVILVVVLATLEFLSRRYRRREELARRRLDEANRLETIGRFARWVAHDIGNLTSIIHSAVLLLRPMTNDKPDAAKLLGDVEQSLRSGRELVNQLLAYSRQQEMRPQAADIGALVTNALPVLGQAAGPGIKIKFEHDRTKAICLIDSVQFQAAMVNLILNSRDAMQTGGTITIRLQITEDEEESRWAQIDIRDDGQGMPQDVLARAFQPFFTTKPQGKGNGLGLSQVLDFVNRSGGQIFASSTKPRGTTMSLRLPLSVSHDGRESMSAT